MSEPAGSRSHTPSPPPRRPQRREEVVVQRVVKEIGGGSYPTLTKTNYADWAALMRVMLQARGLWMAVSAGTDDYVEDRMALEAIAKAVPAEMMGNISGKATAQIAWEAIKTMNVGVERVRKAKASTLRRDFDALKFRDGETVDEFGIRITGIANQLAVFGDGYDEEEVVRKFLQALPSKYQQIAMSIETLLDLSMVSVEELIGRLKAAEERHGLTQAVASLNLNEDELIARVAARLQRSGTGSGEPWRSSPGSSSGSRKNQATTAEPERRREARRQ